MKRYRRGRGVLALEVPDLPTKNDFEKSYIDRYGYGLYGSLRLGDVDQDTLWKNLVEIYRSSSFNDRKWCINVLHYFGFYS